MSSGRENVVVHPDGLGRHDRTGDPKPKTPRRRAVLRVDPASLRNPVKPEPVAEKILPKKPNRQVLLGKNSASASKLMSQKWRRGERADALAEQRIVELARHQQRLMLQANRIASAAPVPKLRQPRTQAACSHRRRAYVKYVFRCLRGRNRKPKHIPSWWRDESLRQIAITAAFA